MALDVELYRRIVYAPGAAGSQANALRRISVIDIAPVGASRTLVFVHGFGGQALQWMHQLRSFGRDARVIAPDMRGHGQSDDPAGLPLNMDALVDDLQLALDKLGVDGAFTLVAHSFGGAVAIEYALQYPERVAQLVLIGVPSQFKVRPALRRLLNIPNPVYKSLRSWLKFDLFASLPTLRRMHDQAMGPWRGDQRMPLAHAPTLVILGQRDQIFVRERYEDAARLIANAQRVVIPVSAHLVQLERPDAVNRAIRRFVDAREPVTAPDTATGPSRRMRWRQYYDPETPETVPIPRQPIETLLANSAREFPSRTALIFFGQRIGYRELDRLSNRFAHALRNLGLQPGDRVAIVLPNIPQCVIAFYGALKAGGIVVLGSPLSSEEAIAHQVSDATARVLVTLTNYRAMAERIAANTDVTEIIYTDVREYLPVRLRLPLARIAVDTVPPHPSATPPRAPHLRARRHSFQRLLRASSAVALDSGRGMDDLALIQYTSGTIDEPKGVMLTHGSLMVNVAQMRHWITEARRGREVTLGVLPLSHIYGVTSCLNLSLALAGALALLPTSRPSAVLQAIRRERPTILPGVPSLYLMIANYPRVRSYGVASIRTCISGSAPLPVEVQEAFEKLTRGRLVEGYGLTEAAPVTHCNPLGGERRVGSIGIPMPGTNAKIVDIESGEEVAPGEIGELLVQGPQVTQGYWNAPADTALALRDGWLHTGDLARMDEDGFFSVVDRKKEMILAGPYNVYPREVEEVLYEHPKILEAAVVSSQASQGADHGVETPDGVAAPMIRAYVVLRNGERATAEEILAFCRERLEAYKAPRLIEFRSELPKNFVGKILRRLLVGPT